MTGAPIDPFIFVCATRYAILRTLTGASEHVARQVLAHAEIIRGEPGAAGAIRREVEEARARILEPCGVGQSAAECEQLAALWDRAMEALA